MPAIIPMRNGFASAAPRYEMSSGSLQLMPFGPALRAQGRDWPLEAVTMVGTKRLENLENCCCTVLEEGIPGDFVETGVWRGGCGILMRAVLATTGDEIRKVWLFDSFAGLPKPDASRSQRPMPCYYRCASCSHDSLERPL